MVTLPGAILVVITTAYRRAGLAYTKWQKHFGKDDDDILVIYGPSTSFNPSLPQHVIDAALDADPEAASAEWLSVWRNDLSDFLDRELIAAATDHGVVVRPPHPAVSYTAFADPSGGRGDSFTLGITHSEGNAVILDCLYERRSPFDPSVVVSEIAQCLREYSVTSVTGDRYAAGWTVEGFGKEGIAYQPSERDRSQIYLDALPLFTAGRARLLDNSRLTHQLASLERRTSRSGKDRVDHPPGGADDLANAAAGALVLAASAAAPALWRHADLLNADRPIIWPVRCRYVFATGAIDGRGVFIGFWASGADYFAAGPRCLLIDYQRTPLTAALFADVQARIAELAAAPVPLRDHTIPAAEPGMILVSPPLCPHAGSPPRLVREAERMLQPAAREALILAAAAQIGAGHVKIADIADATARHLPLPLTEVRPDASPSAAADACLLGIGAALPREAWPREWLARAA